MPTNCAFRIWRQYGGNYAKTGASTFVAPSNPTQMWRLALNDSDNLVPSAITGASLVTINTGYPVEVSGDNTTYCIMAITKDGSLHCIGPTGAINVALSAPTLVSSPSFFPALPIDVDQTRYPGWAGHMDIGFSTGDIFWVETTTTRAGFIDNKYGHARGKDLTATPPAWDGCNAWWATPDGYLVTSSPDSSLFVGNLVRIIDASSAVVPTSVAIKIGFPASSSFYSTSSATLEADGCVWGTEASVYNVYVGNAKNGMIYAFNVFSPNWTATASTPLWKRALTSFFSGLPRAENNPSSPVYDRDTNSIFYSSSNGCLVSLNADTGSLNYAVANGKLGYGGGAFYGPFTTPVLTGSEVAVFLNAAPWTIWVWYNKATGQSTCSFGSGSISILATPGADANGMVIAADTLGNVYAVTNARGACRRVWTVTLNGGMPGSPVISPDGLFVAAGNVLYAFAQCPTSWEWSASTGRCVPCRQGQYFVDLFSGCRDCPAGTFSQGAAPPYTCVPCPPGYFSAYPSSSECRPCAAGLYSSLSSQSSCSGLCPAGTYGSMVAAINASACLPCAAGTYQISQGTSSCIAGPAGLYCNATGQDSLRNFLPCPPGTGSTLTSIQSRDQCQRCLAGSYQNASGAQSCMLCPSGTARSVPGGADLTDCAPCLPGEYGLAEGSTTCLACPPGTWSTQAGATSSAACQACAPGSYNAFSAQSSPSACLLCAPGTFASDSGTKQCSQCPVGRALALPGGTSPDACLPCSPGAYSNSQGTEQCTLCTPGTASPALGASSSSTCQPCAPGSASALSGQSACSACALGTYMPSSGALACAAAPPGTFVDHQGALAPQPCAPGLFNPLGSQINASMCLPCSAGAYASAPGTTACSLCPSGTFSNSPGSRSPMDCAQCPAGTFNPSSGQTSSSCISCPPGTASSTPGASLSSQCTPCSAGYFSLLAGSTSCTLTPAGSFSERSASSPTQCPLGTFSSRAGATSLSACAACPPGKSTASTGASQDSQCLALPFSCPPGTEPSTPTPASGNDCVPLSCAFPLSSTSVACAGCPNSTFGSPGSCAPCPPGALCPGLLSTPLFNFSSFASSSAAAASAAAPSTCPFLTRSANFISAPPPTQALLPMGSIAAVSGGSLLALFLLATMALTLFDRLSGLKLPERLKPYVYMADFMSSARPIAFGEDKQLAEREKSTLGASMTLFAVSALGVMAAVLVSQRATSNTLSQQSLGVLFDTGAAWAWAVAQPAEAMASGLPTGTPASGVYLRFSVSGEPGQCSPQGLSAAGLSEGSWALLPSPPCTDAQYPFTQFTLHCARCMFTSTSALTFKLPYSCQSLLAEAGAVDADGRLRVLSIPPGTTTPPPSAGALMSSVTWALSPLLAQLNNTMDPSACRKGWQLLSQGAVLGPLRKLESPQPGQLTLLPLSSAVSVTVTLALQPYVATTTLSELTTVLQLLSNIMGFQGIIFSVVGFLFGVLAGSRKHSTVRSERNGSVRNVAAVPAKGAGPSLLGRLFSWGGKGANSMLTVTPGDGAEGTAVAQLEVLYRTNPLSHSQRAAPPPSADASPATRPPSPRALHTPMPTRPPYPFSLPQAQGGEQKASHGAQQREVEWERAALATGYAGQVEAQGEEAPIEEKKGAEDSKARAELSAKFLSLVGSVAQVEKKLAEKREKRGGGGKAAYI